MKPAPFAYHRAHDVRGVTELLSELGEDAKVIAGGQSLVAMMNFRLARPTALVDVARVGGLDRMRREGDTLRIGALATHHAVETTSDPDVTGPFGVLPRAARWIGHYPIRTRGTIGGSMAHADSTAEWCLLAVLLDAELVAASVRGSRTIAAADFFHGFLTTALEPDEMIVDVVFPHSAPNAALTEFAQRKGDFAIVAAAVDLRLSGDVVTAGRVALGGVDAVPVRVPEAEALLTGASAGEELYAACADAAATAIDPGSDAHGSAGYRRTLARTLVTRACREAAGR